MNVVLHCILNRDGEVLWAEQRSTGKQRWAWGQNINWSEIKCSSAYLVRSTVKKYQAPRKYTQLAFRAPFYCLSPFTALMSCCGWWTPQPLYNQKEFCARACPLVRMRHTLCFSPGHRKYLWPQTGSSGGAMVNLRRSCEFWGEVVSFWWDVKDNWPQRNKCQDGGRARTIVNHQTICLYSLLGTWLRRRGFEPQGRQNKGVLVVGGSCQNT